MLYDASLTAPPSHDTPQTRREGRLIFRPGWPCILRHLGCGARDCLSLLLLFEEIPALVLRLNCLGWF